MRVPLASATPSSRGGFPRVPVELLATQPWSLLPTLSWDEDSRREGLCGAGGGAGGMALLSSPPVGHGRAPTLVPRLQF